MAQTHLNGQQVVERVLAASQAEDVVVLVSDGSEASLRWAGNSMTTNGLSSGRAWTVVSFFGPRVGSVSSTSVDPDDIEAVVRVSEAAARAAEPAADAMAQALAGVTINKPKAPLVSNVLASAISDPDEIRKRLVEQVTGTVRWRECAAFMAGQGVTTFYELGAGKVLTGLLKRIADGAKGVPIGTPDDVAAFKATR